MRRRRDISDAFDPAQQPDESFNEWRARLHTHPVWLRELADELPHFPKRRDWLLERAAAIDAGNAVAPYRAGDGRFLPAR